MEKKESYTVEVEEKTTKPRQEAPVMEGVPWEKLKFKINVKDFAQLMRDNELYTYEDVRNNSRLVVGLLQRIYKVDLGVVLAFAKEHEEVD